MRRLVAVCAAVAVVLIMPPVLVRSSVEPAAALVKIGFEARPAVIPGPGFSQILGAVKVTRDVTVVTRGAPPATLDVYEPKELGVRPLPIILWIHGGGFLSGSKTQVADYTTILAAKGYAVASLDYALAPGSTYPVPIEQANAAAAYLVEHAAEFHADPTRVFFGGDSAGAQIASELAAVQTNPALASSLDLEPAVPAPNLRGAILFCGLYDMGTVGNSGFPALRTILWSYTGQRDWTEFPRIDELSTTVHVTDRYPPTFLTVGDGDPFQTQAFELAAALTNVGVAVTTLFWQGSGKHLPHEYQFDLTRPEAEQALTDTSDFVAKASQ